MFWVRFTVDTFPLSVQDHPALADTTCGGSSSRDRAEEVDALQTSAWWSQEQAGTEQGQAGVGQDESTPPLVPEGSLISLYVSEQAQNVKQFLFPPISSSVFFLKKPSSLSYQPSLHSCPKAQCVPKLKAPESM